MYAGWNPSVGTLSFGWSPDRTLPPAHSRLVADAADTRVSFRNQVPASANSRGSVQSGVIKLARAYAGVLAVCTLRIFVLL